MKPKSPTSASEPTFGPFICSFCLPKLPRSRFKSSSFCLRASGLSLERVEASRWPRLQGDESQVVGGNVAPLAARHLHQAPFRVPPFVVRLQDSNRSAGLKRNLVVSSGSEIVRRQHLQDKAWKRQNISKCC